MQQEIGWTRLAQLLIKMGELYLSDDHKKLAIIYGNIGELYSEMDNYKKTLSFLLKQRPKTNRTEPELEPDHHD